MNTGTAVINEMMTDYFNNFYVKSRSRSHAKFIFEKCYTKYESLNEVYLIKNRLNPFFMLKKYPRVIVIDRTSKKWWVIPER